MSVDLLQVKSTIPTVPSSQDRFDSSVVVQVKEVGGELGEPESESLLGPDGEKAPK